MGGKGRAESDTESVGGGGGGQEGSERAAALMGDTDGCLDGCGWEEIALSSHRAEFNQSPDRVLV